MIFTWVAGTSAPAPEIFWITCNYQSNCRHTDMMRVAKLEIDTIRIAIRMWSVVQKVAATAHVAETLWKGGD